MGLEDILDLVNIGENSFTSKIEYILENNKEELIKITNKDERIDFFINHFVMSDFESKQLQSYLKKHGTDGFMKLIKEIILKKV